MIFEFLARLQGKPQAVRKRIVWGVSFGVTVIILIVWFSTLSSRTASVQDTENVPDATPDVSPFDSLNNAFQNAREQFDNVPSFEDIIEENSVGNEHILETPAPTSDPSGRSVGAPTESVGEDPNPALRDGQGSASPAEIPDDTVAEESL